MPRSGGARFCALLAALVLTPPVATADTAREQPSMPAADKDRSPLPASKSELVPFEHSAFPYDGIVPANGKPFLDVSDGARRGHDSPRGGVYWQQPTYSDRRTLLYIPKGFDLNRPALIVVFFHGNRTLLERDVRDRQQVPRQLADSGLNAVLVSPQLAVDALDSSAGRFWEPGLFARFVDEAGERLARLHGDPRAKQRLARAPVVIVAYSGGYLPAAYSARVGDTAGRVLGMILLDAPYSEEEVIADWVAKRPSDIFFLSAFAAPSRAGNTRLRELFTARGVRFHSGLPDRLLPGTIGFFDLGNEVEHQDLVTQAWVRDPLTALLARIPGFARNP